MEDQSRHDPIIAAELDFFAAETELQQHANDPLNTELRVWIQPLTLTRLQRYLDSLARSERSRDVLVNAILAQWLYDMGE